MKLGGIAGWKSIRIQNGKQIREMFRKINPKFNRNKYKELHVGRSINGTNEGEDSAGDNSSSERD